MEKQLLLDEFDQHYIQQALTTLAIPETPSFLKQMRPRFDIHVFEQLASTNETLWAMANARAGTVAIAHTQTAGKGQRGKQWLSAPGGVYLSLMLEPDWPAEHAAQLTLCSAWGIVSQFRHLGIPAQIKWPNDIVVKGQKLGGILSESKLEKETITRAVIGVGINVHNPVPATGITWQTLTTSHCRYPQKGTTATSLSEVAAAVLLGIWRGILYRNHVDGQTFTAVYQSLLTNLNKPVILEGRTFNVVGITEMGHLTLKVTSQDIDEPVEQLVYIKSGEFSFGYPQSGVR